MTKKRGTSVAGDPPAARSPAPRSKGGDCRGLLINSTHISKFLAPVVTRKTHEVRNTSCRVVKAGGQIYLVESGIKNSEKKGVFRIAARAEFRGNTFVPHGDFMKHFAKHRVTCEEYDAVKKGWVDKGGCQLWELIIKEVYDPPLYLVPRQGEDRQTGLALLASVDCLAQGFQKKTNVSFFFQLPTFSSFFLIKAKIQDS